MITILKISLVSIFVSVISTAALAHVKIGTYNGKTSDGGVCAITISQVAFEGGLHHPLNERVSVQVGTQAFVLSHPSSVNTQSHSVSFNHDALQGVIPNPNGADALVIDMDHSPGKDGPTAFHLIQDNWAQGSAQSMDCTELKFSALFR